MKLTDQSSISSRSINMVYESDFYTSRRPYSRPTITSYSVTKLNDVNEWDSPYSWPVRREFSRILHRPRPHFGIVYTERFLNSRPLTYFDDETKLIRAKAGAILKAVHTPVPKPSRILRPYETLDSYRSHQLIPYGVPQHVYHQSHFNEPAHLTIGRGHLACIQYAGGKGYPRRKNLYSDENRNIRDEIKFRSYYNRPKPEDPNTLPTGFAWRLLHLPPKDDKPFKLYKQSRTLPLTESVKREEKTSLNEDKENRPIKRIHKTHTQPLDDVEKTEISNVRNASKKPLVDQPIETYTSKAREEKIEKPPVEEAKGDIFEEPKNSFQNSAKEELQTTDEKAKVEEMPNITNKKNKKKKDEEIVENTYNRSFSHSKSISEETPAEKQENIEIVETSSKSEPEVETVQETSEDIVQENKSDTKQENPIPVAEPEVEVITEEPKIEPMEDTCQTQDNKNEITHATKTDEAEPALVDNPKSCIELPEEQEAVLESVLEPQQPVETMEEVKEEIAIVPAGDNSELADSQQIETKAVEDDSNCPDISEVNPEETLSHDICDSSKISDLVNESEPSDDKEKPVSETVQECTKQDEAELCNGSEISTELQNKDDSGELEFIEVHDETQVIDQITELSSAEITHSTEETVMHALSLTQISQVPEDSDKPEDLVNETDITTDEENVEISME